MWCWVRSVGYPLIGRLSSNVIRHFLFLGLPFFVLPVLVFLVFLEFASSSRYWSMRDLLPKRVEPSERASSFVRTQSTMSCCCCSSWVGLDWPVVLEGGDGLPGSDVPAPASAAPAVV